MKFKFLIASLIYTTAAVAQIPTTLGFTLSDEFSESIALEKAQGFLLRDIIHSNENVIEFKLDRISSSMSGELTSFIYLCEEREVKGLILAFYGDYWNDSGDLYKGFVFKNIPDIKAKEFIAKISRTMEEQKEVLSKDNDNNVSFKFDGLDVVISKDMEFKIRLFWNGFDSDWDHWAFSRTKRVIEEGLK